MKRLLLLFTPLLFASCSTYYYSTVASENPNSFNNTKHLFITENDSVCIAYSFFGENAPINISIFNKTDKPIYVNWEESALILNNNSSSYHSKVGKISGTIISNTYIYGDFFSETRSTYNGSISYSPSLSFIPPHTEINNTPLQLANFDFEKIPRKEFNKVKFGGEQGIIDVNMRTYTQDESPLQFRSYLTLYTDNPNKENSRPIVFEQNFYLSSVIKTSEVSPSEVVDYNVKKGNFFYAKKVKGRGFANALGVIAISTVIVANEISRNSNNN